MAIEVMQISSRRMPGMANTSLEDQSSTFGGKIFPSWFWWSDSSSIASEILVDELKSLESLGIYSRGDNYPKSFLILEDHPSCLHLPFLQDVDEPEDNWVVCKGGQCGTASWQVGDSKEKNSSFNISVSKIRILLLKEDGISSIGISYWMRNLYQQWLQLKFPKKWSPIVS